MGLLTADPQLPAPIRGHVILLSHEAGLHVAARNFELPRVVNERAGGWRSTPRARLRPVSTWDGYQELRVRLTLLLDTTHDRDVTGTPAHEAVRTLRALGRQIPELRRPAAIRAIGKLPEPYDRARTIRWVIAGLEIAEIDFTRRGVVTRARAVVDLGEFNEPDVEVTPSLRPGQHAREHVWRRTDTLHDLAERLLGDRRRHLDIRAANPRIKRWSSVAEGTRITIPPA